MIDLQPDFLELPTLVTPGKTRKRLLHRPHELAHNLFELYRDKGGRAYLIEFRTQAPDFLFYRTASEESIDLSAGLEK